MVNDSEAHNVGSLHRDNWLSVLLGPTRLIIPALSYLLVYPIIISNSSIEVLGLWSILASTMSFLSMADAGFSQLLVRNGGSDKMGELSATYLDYKSANVIYACVGCVATLCVLLFSEELLSPLKDTYSVTSLSYAVAMMVMGTIFQLASKLDGAMLRARHENHFVQLVESLTPIATYGLMIAGAVIRMPIEGLAIGTLLTGLMNLAIFRYRSKYKSFIFSDVVIDEGESIFGNIPSIGRRGWVLFSTSLGLMCRAPLYRYLLAMTAGLPTAAIFDIGMRVTQTARDAVAAGFGVLYPSFSLLIREKNTKEIVNIARIALMFLIPIGALLLGLLSALVKPMLSVWLGDYPAMLDECILILAIWQMITLFNVPFWNLLLSSENEKFASIAIWAHSISLLLILPIYDFIDLTFLGLLIYWVITSLLTQLLIFFFVQTRLGLFLPVFLQPRLGLTIVAALAFFVACQGIESKIENYQHLVLGTALLAAAYLMIVMPLIFRPIFNYVRRK
jgi:O-antigen/teichoic acid export membrane protein